MTTTAIVNGAVFTGSGLTPKTVVVDGDRITELADPGVAVSADTVIDATGRAVLPGLINVHTHLSFMYYVGYPYEAVTRPDTELVTHGYRMSKVLLAQGITFARDMGGPNNLHVQLRDLIRRGALIGPDVMAAGSPLVAQGRHAWQICEEINGPDEAVAAVRRQFKLGADFIKLMASDDPVPCTPWGTYTLPGMSPEEVRAAFDEVKRNDRLACCHVMGEEAIQTVLDAGADILDHGHYLTPAQAERMAKTGVYLTPTLSSYDVQTAHPRFNRGADWAARHAPLLGPHEDSIRAAVAAGVKNLIGTDTVGCYAEEIAMLREYGVSAVDTILGATTWAAEALRIDKDHGSIAPGKLANLAIVGEGVLDDAYAIEDVSHVMRRGVVHDPLELVADEANTTTNLWELARSPQGAPVPA